VLLDLASAGPANVGLLAERTGVDPNTLSHHLGKLKDEGLLDCPRKRKERWYEAVPSPVHFHPSRRRPAIPRWTGWR
jgi:DNA-binding transcriptional ArsR family regulator